MASTNFPRPLTAAIAKVAIFICAVFGLYQAGDAATPWQVLKTGMAAYQVACIFRRNNRMTTNERELAQLTRAAVHDQAEQALVLVEVAARDEAGNITQYRRLRTVTETEARAFLRRKKATREGG
jgi:hypothetical protein